MPTAPKVPILCIGGPYDGEFILRSGETAYVSYSKAYVPPLNLGSSVPSDQPNRHTATYTLYRMILPDRRRVWVYCEESMTYLEADTRLRELADRVPQEPLSKVPPVVDPSPRL